MSGEPLSAANPRIKQLRRLSGRRSARHEAGRFVIEGEVLVREAIAAGLAIDEVFVEVGASPTGLGEVAVREVVAGALRSALSTDTPQPVCAVAPTDVTRPVAGIVGAAIAAGRPVLVLVDVADPGNVGTMLRAAEASGCAGAVVVGRSVDIYNPKVVRSSAGSMFRLPIGVADEVDGLFTSLGELPTVAAVVRGGTPHLDAPLEGAVAVVVGNEAHGLAPDVVERCTSSVTISMDGPTESLNAAMAATVLCFEAWRRRHGAPGG